MKLAVVAGGWHFPLDFYQKAMLRFNGADLFVIAHRNPELSIVREEKYEILRDARGPLADVDRNMYSAFPTIAELRALRWNYAEQPNTIGDWEFFNQWLAMHDYRDYDVILNCHDDTFIRPPALFSQLAGDWLLLANGKYPEAPEGYVRGSFEFWKRELLDMLGGHIDIGNCKLTRVSKIDTPTGMKALSEWNKTSAPLRNFMVRKGVADRISYLSDYYRVSRFVIEGERGFMHFRQGAPWSFDAGLNAFPLKEIAA